MKKRFWMGLLLLSMAVCMEAVGVRDSVITDSVRRDYGTLIPARLQRLLADNGALAERTQISVSVYDLTAQRPLFTHQARQRMRPASTMKLLTAITALDRLGTGYAYRTELYADAVRPDSLGNFPGCIYVRGAFDPRLGAQELRTFADTLLSRGIRRIGGYVMLDVSLKDGDRLGWGWCWDDDAQTNPPLVPLLYDGRDSFRQAFLDVLARAGINVEGSMREGNVPGSLLGNPLAVVLCSIDQILLPMMKQSDNLYAESLFYNLAAAGGHRPASRRDGAAEIARLADRLGLRGADYEFADGSGVSLYGYASAELLVAFLRYAYSSEAIYAHLLPSLPVAGEDGTLRRRMTTGSAHGNVRAKTGTVTGVSTLAGYATAPDGHMLCFAIMNQGVPSIADGRRFQDAVCVALTEP